MTDFSFAVPTWTADGNPTFPNGTTVYATPLDGSVDDAITAIVSGGTVAFTGLLPNEKYLARATVNGVVREVRFTAPDSASGESNAAPVAFTINSTDGNGNPTQITQAGVVTTYTWNADGTPATETRAGITRTFTYSAGVLTGATTP